MTTGLTTGRNSIITLFQNLTQEFAYVNKHSNDNYDLF